MNNKQFITTYQIRPGSLATIKKAKILSHRGHSQSSHQGLLIQATPETCSQQNEAFRSKISPRSYLQQNSAESFAVPPISHLNAMIRAAAKPPRRASVILPKSQQNKPRSRDASVQTSYRPSRRRPPPDTPLICQAVKDLKQREMMMFDLAHMGKTEISFGEELQLITGKYLGSTQSDPLDFRTPKSLERLEYQRSVEKSLLYINNWRRVCEDDMRNCHKPLDVAAIAKLLGRYLHHFTFMKPCIAFSVLHCSLDDLDVIWRHPPTQDQVKKGPFLKLPYVVLHRLFSWMEIEATLDRLDESYDRINLSRVDSANGSMEGEMEIDIENIEIVLEEDFNKCK